MLFRSARHHHYLGKASLGRMIKPSQHAGQRSGEICDGIWQDRQAKARQSRAVAIGVEDKIIDLLRPDPPGDSLEDRNSSQMHETLVAPIHATRQASGHNDTQYLGAFVLGHRGIMTVCRKQTKVERIRARRYRHTMPATVSPQTFAILRLDLRGLKCPLPVLRVQKELDLAQAGTLVIAECTDPMAAIDLPNLARESGNVYEGAAEGSGFTAYRIRKAAAP